MGGSEETVVLALELVGIPAAMAALVEVEAAVLDWVVQVAASLEAAWAEVLDQAAVAVMAPAGALVEPAPEVLVVAP